MSSLCECFLAFSVTSVVCVIRVHRVVLVRCNRGFVRVFFGFLGTVLFGDRVPLSVYGSGLIPEPISNSDFTSSFVVYFISVNLLFSGCNF